MSRVVFTTVKNLTEARRLGKLLVTEKIAACVTAVPKVESTYRWRGKVERSSEVMLLIKTSAQKIDELISRVKELHSYKVPEVLVFRVEGGLPEYLKWIEESVV